MSVVAIAEAREKMNDAQAVLKSEAKNAINSAVLALLQTPGIDSVSWAQKSSEYNDEGMYPGVFGPVLNHTYKDLEDRWDDDIWYDALYYGGAKSSVDPRTAALKSILNDVGEEILSDLFGNEDVVDAVLRADGRVVYDTEYAGC